MRGGFRTNICFHGIGTPGRALEEGEDRYWISPDFFDRILDLVADDPHVALSFDDGNASDVQFALPALRDRRLRATFFPVADRMDRAGSVGRADVRELVDAGMTVGSHGMHHQPWRGLDAAALDEELDTARGMIAEAAGAPVSAAACPLGSYDRRVLKRLQVLGYAQVFTSDRAHARRATWLQPRYSVRHTDSLDDIRALVEQRPALRGRIEATARTTVKRWR